jgi:hypothetical protein
MQDISRPRDLIRRFTNPVEGCGNAEARAAIGY